MGSLPKDQTGTIGAPAGTVENTLDSCGTATDEARHRSQDQQVC